MPWECQLRPVFLTPESNRRELSDSLQIIVSISELVGAYITAPTTIASTSSSESHGDEVKIHRSFPTMSLFPR